MSQLLSPEQVAQSAVKYLQQATSDPDWKQIEQYLTELFLAQSRSAYEQAIQTAKTHRSGVSGGMFGMAHRARDEAIEDIVDSIQALKTAC